MKFRQAEKIIKRRNPCDIGFNSPSVNKAIVVFLHHKKKSHPYYKKVGILRALRWFYEITKYI